MEKILLTVFAVCVLSIVPSQAMEIGKSVGVSMSMNALDTTLTDDIDNNGTVTTTKDIADDVSMPSLFGELNLKGDRAVLTVGLDWIPFGGELHTRSTTQSTLGAIAAGAASSGTNRGTLDVSNHMTWYIQPGAMITDNTMLYLSWGSISADTEATYNSVSSGSKTVEQTLDGETVGFGIKKFNDSGGFIRLEYAATDYDKISVTTAGSTKVTADADSTRLTLSLGKSF
ncbi:MAG: hypothetical protein H8E55_50110 [Pelagibacterales bacterium]|nr:hypothetical protein [Pelagibacterales bacterium]